MSEHVFKSRYSVEEIEKNFKDADFFSGIEEGLKEALAYEKESAGSRTFARKRSLPERNVKAETESFRGSPRCFDKDR